MLLDDTAAGNAALALHVRGVPMAARRSQVGGALAMLGIKHRETELAGTLSGGERQRVAIARAIAANPTLILADEPTGALDTANTQNAIDHLRRLNDSGTTVVVITHDQTVAAAAKRRIEIIDGVVHDDARIGSSVVPTSERVGDHPLPHGRFGSRVVGEVFASLSGLCSNVGRTLLLLLAFALGAGGLVASVGISESATNQIAERLTAASLDEVTVRLADPGAYEAGLYDAGSHISAAIRSLPHVRRLGFVASLPRTTAEVRLLPPTVPGPSFAGTVIVAGAGYLATQGATVVPAHAAAILDNTWNGSVALVGKDAARQLGISSVGPGSLLWLGERSVDVIGIIDDAGRDERLTDSVVLSSAAARGLTADDPRLIVRTESGYPAAIAEAIPVAVRPDQPSSVHIDTVADLRNLRVGVGDDLSMLIATVSVLLLILALLLSAVAMFMSVRTRAGQIALRRAVGASRASVGRLFLFEGLMIGVAGGITGTALGLCAIVIFCASQGWAATLDPGIVLVGALAGSVSGLLSSLYPALAAAHQDPAQAIRGS